MDLACLYPGVKHHSLFCSQTDHCLTALHTVAAVTLKTQTPLLQCTYTNSLTTPDTRGHNKMSWDSVIAVNNVA